MHCLLSRRALTALRLARLLPGIYMIHSCDWDERVVCNKAEKRSSSRKRTKCPKSFFGEHCTHGTRRFVAIGRNVG